MCCCCGMLQFPCAIYIPNYKPNCVKLETLGHFEPAGWRIQRWKLLVLHSLKFTD